MASWARWAVTLGVGLAAFGVVYDLVMHYEMWVLAWHQGSVALGWGPFQLFYAQVIPRPGEASNVKMGMGSGVLVDPVLLAYLTHRLLLLTRSVTK
ncbi:MAG: hypothetical protein OWU84_13665 [Firmicutes bacterium]|nr:hypothetical protein [Bacillota bacterium]